MSTNRGTNEQYLRIFNCKEISMEYDFDSRALIFGFDKIRGRIPLEWLEDGIIIKVNGVEFSYKK